MDNYDRFLAETGCPRELCPQRSFWRALDWTVQEIKESNRQSYPRVRVRRAESTLEAATDLLIHWYNQEKEQGGGNAAVGNTWRSLFDWFENNRPGAVWAVLLARTVAERG